MRAKKRRPCRELLLSLPLHETKQSARLKRSLQQGRKEEPFYGKYGLDSKYDFGGHIETGFQLATFQGPLCAEPVEGLAYFVESVQVNVAAVEEEIGR